MKDVLNSTTYETQNVSLASFLILEGIKLLECKKNPKNPNVIMMTFQDDAQNCLDLERVFLNSNYKRYFDINKYLLSKVHQTLRN